MVTSRLTLTPLVETDADAMVEVLSDARMYEFTGGSPLSIDELRARYRRLVVGRSSDHNEIWLNWIVRTTPGEVVGWMQASVTADGSTADVAWQIGVRWQGRGLASEAARAVVDWLTDRDVAQIRALIHPNHAASARVAARAGLEPTTELVDDEVVWQLPAR